MRCRAASRLMSLHLDAALSLEGLARLSRHLEQCAACRSRWQAMQRADRLLLQAPFPDVPVGLTARVLEQLPAERRAVVPTASPVWIRAGLLVAAVLLVFIVGLSLAAVALGLPMGQGDWGQPQEGGQSVVSAVWENALVLVVSVVHIASALWQALRWPWVPLVVVAVIGAAFVWRWFWQRSGRGGL